MSDLRKLSMSALISLHNELAEKLGMSTETSFKNLAAARQTVTNLESKMNQATQTGDALDDVTNTADTMEQAPKNNQIYNSSGKRGPTQGIGAYAKDRILAGLANPEILAEIAEKFPSAKTTTGCIAYYRTALAKAAKAAEAPVAETADVE